MSASTVDVYPGEDCRGRVGCVSCPSFFCVRCKKYLPWCAGSADAHISWCDDCWWKRHRRWWLPCLCCWRHGRRWLFRRANAWEIGGTR